MQRDANARSVPYWLWGDELCEHCLQRYVFEEEYRCAACDGAVCRDCVLVVRRTREVLCPSCPDTEACPETEAEA